MTEQLESWTTCKLGNNADQYEVHGDVSGRTIAVTHDDPGGSHAAMISAAPDLLAACERAEIDLRDFADRRGKFRPTPAGLLSIARELSAATAKAKGQT